VAFSSGDQTQNTGVFPAMQESVCTTANSGVVYPKYGLGFSASQNGTYGVYLQHQYLEGCMYMNEHGQMCGPYPPEQLYEGLSTGFLPQDLAIYAVFGGKTADPVPLSFLNQFLSQWNFGANVSTPNAYVETKKIPSHAKTVLPDVGMLFFLYFYFILHLPACLPEFVGFCFLPIRIFQVKNRAGCSRMRKAADKGHILLLNFPIGITIAISKICQW
jgi:hypothetical protein